MTDSQPHQPSSSVGATPEAPPLERNCRHGSPNAKPSTIRLTDVDGERMPAASFYKTMSLDIVEGHQIGLYYDDGRLKYPKHHSLLGGVATAAAAAAAASVSAAEPPIVGIVRRRPASANPSGRQLNPESVRDVMNVSDIDGAAVQEWSRTRQENNILNVADLNQKKKELPAKVDAVGPTTRAFVPDCSGFEAYNSSHRHTSMHRPCDQAGARRPHSASIAGRATGPDPLNPIYCLSAPSSARNETRKISPTKNSDLVRAALQCSQQPCPGQERQTVAFQGTVVGTNIVYSLPINNKGKHGARKGAGQYRDALTKDSAKILMEEPRPENASPSYIGWDKLQCSKEVNHRQDHTKEIREALLSKRATETRRVDPEAVVDMALATDGCVPRTLNANIDYGDVPFSSIQWKMKLLEMRSKRKQEKRTAEETAAEEEKMLRSVPGKGYRCANPLEPNYPPLGVSKWCSTTTAQFTEHTKHHEDSFDAAAKRGCAPKRHASPEPRHLRQGECAGTESCVDIEGAQSSCAWKVPPTSSSVHARIAKDICTAALLAKQGGDFAALVGGGDSSLLRSSVQKVRPSSATIRSASTGALPRDQQEREGGSQLSTSGVRGEVGGGAAARVGRVCSDVTRPVEEQRRATAAFFDQKGTTSHEKASGSCNLQQRSRIVVKPPTHAASRKELLYKKEVDSVRSLPNFV